MRDYWVDARNQGAPAYRAQLSMNLRQVSHLVLLVLDDCLLGQAFFQNLIRAHNSTPSESSSLP